MCRMLCARARGQMPFVFTHDVLHTAARQHANLMRSKRRAIVVGGGELKRRQCVLALGSPPCHICAGTGLPPATSARGLGSPLPHPHLDWARRPLIHLHRDWARPCHIRTGTGLTPVTSAPGLRLWRGVVWQVRRALQRTCTNPTELSARVAARWSSSGPSSKSATLSGTHKYPRVLTSTHGYSQVHGHVWHEGGVPINANSGASARIWVPIMRACTRRATAVGFAHIC